MIFKSKRKPLLACHVIHGIPGRIRIGSRALHFLGEQKEEIENRLTNDFAVTSATLTSVSENIVINFDPSKTSAKVILVAIANLSPAYFAMVMATGIVSIASHLLGFRFLDIILLWLNVVFYTLLWVLTIARVLLYPERIIADLSNHLIGVGFFTMVAATCVLGSQFVLLKKAYTLGLVFLGVGAFLWIVLIYSIFTAFTIRRSKPQLAEGINGVWLVAVVATQSISILSSLVSSSDIVHRELFLFVSICLYLLGGLFYILIIVLIFYRFMFFSMLPEALGPPYWINMGAVAISTLAGAALIVNSSEVQFFKNLLPFTTGTSLFFWSAATWWIPFLFVLEIWKLAIRRVGFRYEPQYWGLVFPLGMYTVCTYQLAKALDLRFLAAVPRYFVYIALSAWLITFAGLLKMLAQSLFSGFFRSNS